MGGGYRGAAGRGGVIAAAPRLVSDRFVLRLADDSDVPAMLAYRRQNAEYLAPFEPARTADHFSEEFWQRKLAEHRREFEAGEAVRMVLFGSGVPAEVLGIVAFSNIIRGPLQSCFLGYALAEQEQGKGLMTDALRLGIGYMFDEMRIHRISANYLPNNTASGAVLKRLGFTVEGYARDYLRIDGTWQDHILTSLLNPAWSATAS